jgi:hypothetical protein
MEDFEDTADDWDIDDPDRWLWVHSQGSRSGYRDMEWFISEIDDPEVADRLRIAISCRGAFRRFKDTLSRWPDLMTRWFAFSEDRQRGRAPPGSAMKATSQPLETCDTLAVRSLWWSRPDA